MESKIQQQLNILFLNLFDKQSLRRNAYFFKYLTQDLCLPVKCVYQQKKVAAITNNRELINKVLSNCSHIQSISEKTIKLRMEGDFKLVRLFNMKDKKMGKKKLQEHSQKMKRQITQQKDRFEVDFQSHAAAIEFIEKLKQDPQVDFQFSLQAINPYYSIKDSVANYKKQRNNHFYNNSNPSTYHKQKDQNYKLNYDTQNMNVYTHIYQNSNNYSSIKSYPIFIRKAIDTDEQDEDKNAKKQKTYQSKYKPSINDFQAQNNKLCELNGQDFPSIIQNNQIKQENIQKQTEKQEKYQNCQKQKE